MALSGLMWRHVTKLQDLFSVIKCRPRSKQLVGLFCGIQSSMMQSWQNRVACNACVRNGRPRRPSISRSVHLSSAMSISCRRRHKISQQRRAGNLAGTEQMAFYWRRLVLNSNDDHTSARRHYCCSTAASVHVVPRTCGLRVAACRLIVS